MQLFNNFFASFETESGLFISDIESGKNIVEGAKIEVSRLARKGENELVVLNQKGIFECQIFNNGELEEIMNLEEMASH